MSSVASTAKDIIKNPLTYIVPGGDILSGAKSQVDQATSSIVQEGAPDPGITASDEGPKPISVRDQLLNQAAAGSAKRSSNEADLPGTGLFGTAKKRGAAARSLVGY